MSNVINFSGGSAEHLRGLNPGSGGGGGESGGMEPRVAKLEADVDHIKRDIAEIKGDLKSFSAHEKNVVERLAKIEERLQHVPTKAGLIWGGLTLLVSISGALAALLRLMR